MSGAARFVARLLVVSGVASLALQVARFFAHEVEIDAPEWWVFVRFFGQVLLVTAGWHALAEGPRSKTEVVFIPGSER